MPPVGFEATILVSERSKTHALDRTATGIGMLLLLLLMLLLLLLLKLGCLEMFQMFRGFKQALLSYLWAFVCSAVVVL
jgi:hypothetical protein